MDARCARKASESYALSPSSAREPARVTRPGANGRSPRCPSRLAAASHTAAIDRVEQIVREEAIACHFRRVDGDRTYALGVALPRGAFPRVLLWDTLDPYHYLRLGYAPPSLGDHDLLILGGEDHKTGQEAKPEERFERLERWTRERFPTAAQVLYAWSGQVMEPLDGLAFIGRHPTGEGNVYLVTGDSENGMTHCTLAGNASHGPDRRARQPLGRALRPGRFAYRAAGETAKETANMAAQYLHWLTGGDVRSLEAIAAGGGAVVNRGTRKVAVYRDPAGEFHSMSAVCTHLGCAVGSRSSCWSTGAAA